MAAQAPVQDHIVKNRACDAPLLLLIITLFLVIAIALGVRSALQLPLTVILIQGASHIQVLQPGIAEEVE
jgi:hypothetical protein